MLCTVDDLSIPATIRAGYAHARTQLYARLAHEAHLEAENYEAVRVSHGSRHQLAAIMASARAVLRLTPELKQFLGVPSSATIALYERQGDKTHRKHWKVANDCFAAMDRPGTQLAYVGTTQRRGVGVFQLVFRTSGAALVFIVIKFVPKGRAPEDECWVTTLHATDASEVQRQVRRGELEHVFDATALGDLHVHSENRVSEPPAHVVSRLVGETIPPHVQLLKWPP